MERAMNRSLLLTPQIGLLTFALSACAASPSLSTGCLALAECCESLAGLYEQQTCQASVPGWITLPNGHVESATEAASCDRTREFYCEEPPYGDPPINLYLPGSWSTDYTDDGAPEVRTEWKLYFSTNLFGTGRDPRVIATGRVTSTMEVTHVSGTYRGCTYTVQQGGDWMFTEPDRLTFGLENTDTYTRLQCDDQRQILTTGTVGPSTHDYTMTVDRHSLTLTNGDTTLTFGRDTQPTPFPDFDSED